jgi:heme/copper-type cytochrome/quinol oxidase subunit 2
MYKFFLRVVFFIALVMMTVLAKAQDSLKNEKPQMADLMRSNGKIYVVVTVVLIILAGLFVYLVQLDRKLSRLEKSKN